MKFYLLAATALACATSSIMSMENEQARLNFLLDNNWCIEGNSAEDMPYEVQPEVFLGKKITEAVPLNDQDKDAISRALNEAAQRQATTKVKYTLNDKNFIAKVTPIIKANKENNFFLKVTESRNIAAKD